MIRTFVGTTTLSWLLFSAAVTAAQIDIAGPAGSGEFGKRIYLLPNGNFVVTDPGFDQPAGAADVGAVYLYRPDGGLIYTLRGSSAGDHVGGGFITVLSNGHFVVPSPDWDNGGLFDAGAVTWCNGVSGSNAIVSAGNSLVGGSASNRVGSGSVYALTNGNYVIASYEWDSSSVIDAGAATWGNGAGGSAGVVSASNSLVGSSAGDQVGQVTALSNGNYVIQSPGWDNGGIVDAGAATWGNGATGTSGVVSVGNSLVGRTANDEVSGSGVVALANGHYVVSSYHCDNGNIDGAGAVTWGNGVSGTTGVVSASNSLVGGAVDDILGQRVIALSNGHYVVGSYIWDNAGIVDAGIMAWVNGTGTASGVPNAANALVGGSPGDRVGITGITELSNGNYVVISYDWDNGAIVDAGAVTWRNGTGGGGGVVSASNSLVGSSTGDNVGRGGVAALSNGHYVVSSPQWVNAGLVNSGAATWRNGTSGIGAVVSTSNSLVSNQANSAVSQGGVAALSNGHYVVSSPFWDNGSADAAGAVTWRNGTSGSGGLIGVGNSLVGSSAGDLLGGQGGVIALTNGHYTVRSPQWKNSGVQVGAVTWCNGTNLTSATVSTSNSLVGSTLFDGVGSGVTMAQGNGNYVAWSPAWDNGAIVDAGAFSLGFGNGTTIGAITAANSVRGTVASGSGSMNFVYDNFRAQLIVNRPASNIVSLLRPGATTAASIILDTPDPSGPGEVVTFVVTLVATPAPASGSVRVAADTGETCTDSSPTATGPNTAEFSCQILFANLGARSVRAEFLGTNTHGYSASGPEPHTVSHLFADGFE